MKTYWKGDTDNKKLDSVSFDDIEDAEECLKNTDIFNIIKDCVCFSLETKYGVLFFDNVNNLKDYIKEQGE